MLWKNNLLPHLPTELKLPLYYKRPHERVFSLKQQPPHFSVPCLTEFLTSSLSSFPSSCRLFLQIFSVTVKLVKKDFFSSTKSYICMCVCTCENPCTSAEPVSYALLHKSLDIFRKSLSFSHHPANNCMT